VYGKMKERACLCVVVVDGGVGEMMMLCMEGGIKVACVCGAGLIPPPAGSVPGILEPGKLCVCDWNVLSVSGLGGKPTWPTQYAW